MLQSFTVRSPEHVATHRSTGLNSTCRCVYRREKRKAWRRREAGSNVLSERKAKKKEKQRMDDDGQPSTYTITLNQVIALDEVVAAIGNAVNMINFHDFCQRHFVGSCGL